MHRETVQASRCATRKDNMIKCLLILEDNVFDVELSTTSTPPWVGSSVDRFSGKRQECKLTTEQVAAIVWLGIMGDDGDKETTTKMYAIAEEAVAGWPNECRPMP